MALWGAKVSHAEPFVLKGRDDFNIGVYNAALASCNPNHPVHLYLGIDDEKFLLGTFRPGSVDQFAITVEITTQDENTYTFSVEPDKSEVHLTGALLDIEPPYMFNTSDDDDDEFLHAHGLDGDDDDDDDDDLEDSDEDGGPAIEELQEERPRLEQAKKVKAAPEKAQQPVAEHVHSGDKKGSKGGKGGKPVVTKSDEKAKEPPKAEAPKAEQQGGKRPAPPQAEQPPGKRQKTDGTGSVKCAHCDRTFNSATACEQHAKSKHQQQ